MCSCEGGHVQKNKKKGVEYPVFLTYGVPQAGRGVPGRTPAKVVGDPAYGADSAGGSPSWNAPPGQSRLPPPKSRGEAWS